MRLALWLLLLAALVFGAVWLLDFSALTQWAVAQQRAFQNQMAGAIRALQSGQPGAYAALLGAAGAYGIVHAVGPGHGKYLIGGVGLGTSVSTGRLLGIAVASSLVQSLWAIVLVYGGFWLVELSAQRMTALAEDVLAPASYLAIAAVGLVLVWRGLRALVQARRAVAHDHHSHAHDDPACGCHAHGPTPDEVAKVGTLREAAVLVGSIAIRPCTGAIFLLVIAWQMDIHVAGAAAVVTMGLGTAILTGAVAISTVAARGITWASAERIGAVGRAVPILQTLVGVAIIWMSVILIGATLL